MKKFIVISPDLVWVAHGEGGVTTLDDLPNHLQTKEDALFAILPQMQRVVATERTLDTVMASTFSPVENSFRAEPLEDNVFQVYVARTEMLDRLRSLGRDVYIVPYPAAVRHALSTLNPEAESSLRERTRVFLQALTDTPKSNEKVVVDVLGQDYVITALRGKEILAIRHVRGGEPVMEMQRTLASARMDNPGVLSRDQDFVLELQSQGFEAELPELPGLMVGESVLEKVTSLRYLTDIEVARERARQNKRKAITAFSVGLGCLAVAGGGYGWVHGQMVEARNANLALASNIEAKQQAVASSYQERYASKARAESVSVREELFELSTALPPQVVLQSIERDAQAGLVATVERRPGAAPFSRMDLKSALASSPFFAGAEIEEKFEGHLVRYVLTVKPQPPGAAAAPAQPSP
ncbi:MAG: hypothetical protein RL653_697 [Pseudomonadota bacterium]